MSFHRSALFTVAIAASVLSAPVTASAQGRLNLYCSPQEEWCQLVVTEFEKATGIRVAMTRKSSGETYAQVKAEKDNPRGDVWWGGTGDPHLQAAEEGLLMPYESPRLKELQDWAVAQWRTGKQRTVGIYAGALGFGFNTEQLAKKNLPEPKCWADLTKPEFKGEVQVANPHSSGTSYTLVATMVQLLGEQGGFDYLKKLNLNINQYTKSGAAPIVAAGRGETLIGIVFMHDAITQAVRNFPIKTVAPCEGTGYEIGSMSIIAGARNAENAKKFYDWALSPEAQALGAKAQSYQVPSHKAAATPPQAPKLTDVKLINYDFQKFGSSDERKRLLSKWDQEIKVSN
ncbi:MAG: ABC transporter substrate-binding protein [Alphaproteobacteria bacterium]|nr:ABC transporter substrate-binding protein [Alphaproteobacteria bacterium]